MLKMHNPSFFFFLYLLFRKNSGPKYLFEKEILHSRLFFLDLIFLRYFLFGRKRLISYFYGENLGIIAGQLPLV